ncbi:MAG: calcium/sodium antiporter [Rhodospirillales bacterium]|nr:calcium/sodium antiporter [Rhodospirillales bacterium]
MVYAMLLIGLLLLGVGGDLLVRGAVAVAVRWGISRLVIGITVVGFGTSTPELVTSVEAALIGSPGIAVGNVVGSNIANILLILGLAGLLRPVDIDRRAHKRDGAVLLLTTALCLIVVLGDYLSRAVGLVFVSLLLAYVAVTLVQERQRLAGPANAHSSSSPRADKGEPRSVWAAAALITIGLGATIGGGHVLVTAAVEVAGQLGVSETVIGLTIVAVGTSLPELVTSVMASLRRQSAISFGNVIGSNIYNVLGVLGVTALVHPVAVPAEIKHQDIWVLTAAIVLLIGLAVLRSRLSRVAGGVFLLSYGLYVTALA